MFVVPESIGINQSSCLAFRHHCRPRHSKEHPPPCARWPGALGSYWLAIALGFWSGWALATGTAWAGLCLVHHHHRGTPKNGRLIYFGAGGAYWLLTRSRGLVNSPSSSPSGTSPALIMRLARRGLHASRTPCAVRLFFSFFFALQRKVPVRKGHSKKQNKKQTSIRGCPLYPPPRAP